MKITKETMNKLIKILVLEQDNKHHLVSFDPPYLLGTYPGDKDFYDREDREDREDEDWVFGDEWDDLEEEDWDARKEGEYAALVADFDDRDAMERFYSEKHADVDAARADRLGRLKEAIVKEMAKKKEKSPAQKVRKPTAPPSKVHKDPTKYDRKKEKKVLEEGEDLTPFDLWQVRELWVVIKELKRINRSISKILGPNHPEVFEFEKMIKPLVSRLTELALAKDPDVGEDNKL